MQQIRRGAARQLGGQIIEPPKQPYQIRLGLDVHLRHGVLQFQQGIEDGLFGLGHGVEITQIQIETKCRLTDTPYRAKGGEALPEISIGDLRYA